MNPGFAIAAATVALADRLHQLIGDALPGASVTMLNPSAESLRGGNAFVNLYLFRTVRNAHAANTDLPTRGPGGDPRAAPTLMLDLDYMISFFGDDSRLDPQRLLGLVAGGLNAYPLLEPSAIRQTIAATPWLGGGVPDTAPDGGATPLRVTPINMTPEATARLWSDFVHVPYQLSQFYTVSAVALVVPLPVAPVLPVRRVGLSVRPATPIAIRAIVDATAPDLPLVGGGRMAIRLADPAQLGLSVRLNGRDATGVVAGFDSEGFAALLVDLSVAQPGPLVAGPLLVEVVRGGRATGVRTAILPGLAAAPVVDAAAMRITVTMALDVPVTNMAALLLFGQGGGAAPSVRLPCLPRDMAGATLAASIAGVAAGRYLVAVEIDGVASLLDHDGRGYTGPVVTLP